MLVYHGTSARHLPAILKNGIKPRGAKGNSNWKHSIESNPTTVYFSNAYAPYFGLNSMDVSDGKDDAIVIIEVETDDLPGYLVPDEDALEQVSRNQDGLPPNMGMVDRTRHYRSMAKKYAETDHDFFWSMRTLGTGGHVGMVPASCFKRIATIDVQVDTELAFAFMDAQVSVMNYRFVGAKYRLLTSLIFGDTPNPEDFAALSGFPLILPVFKGGVKVVTLESV